MSVQSVSWRGVLFFLCMLLLGAATPYSAHAVLYLPGETLDPACAPTDAECGIVGQVASSTIGSIPYYATNGSALSATTALTIASNGNVGIGATSSAKLTVGNVATVFGNELVTNGAFTGNASGWSLGNCAVYGSNAVTITYDSCNDPTVSTTFATTEGTTYLRSLFLA